MKTGFTVSISRTAMIGGGLSYDVRVPVECVPNYDGSRYITICSDARRFVYFSDATLPESHFQMPKGWERYEQYKAHQRAAKQIAFDLAAFAFPELEAHRKACNGVLPDLWIVGLMNPETSEEKSFQCHEYACGCLVPTGEAGRYYDHACATCHRENWTRKQ